VAETRAFEAEVSRLLDLVANSLYSEQEIFLRELIANASDACDRLRYLALTDPAVLGDTPDFRIAVRLEPRRRTLVVADNGIGMSHDELVENLGTIARSGTAAFVERLSGENGTDTSLIGQFGVGFYSAFMVADRVDVVTRRAGESVGWRWSSDGKGEYTIDEADDAPVRGTEVRLHLRADRREYMEADRLRAIVRRYSDHIALPIYLEQSDEEPAHLNQASALWARAPREIDDEQYGEFYRHVSHNFDAPWLTVHFKSEGRTEYTCLVFVPGTRPLDIFHPERKHGVRLYVRRVFITDDYAELVPTYLRFLSGVVDSEDLPLNISRETLQHNPLIRRIRDRLTRQVLRGLKRKAEREPESYADFWSNFGAVLKEGLAVDPDRRDELLELCRFSSSRGEERTSLAEYVERMPEGQDAIYYLSGDQLERLRSSPHLEAFAAKGVEVLLTTDAIDEIWLQGGATFGDGIPFRSVSRGAIDLSAVEGAESTDDADDTDASVPDDDIAALITRLA
jgi:molecular chaperone HtpG